MPIPYDRKLIPYAKNLRKKATPQEDKLWYQFLKDYPIRFQRQKTIHSFIADFYCFQAKLIIEIDGCQHSTAQGLAYDRDRTAILQRYSLDVIRFTNQEITHRFSAVCASIDSTVRKRILLHEAGYLKKQSPAGELPMKNYIIKQMETEEEINGKGYVHYIAWHETYKNLVDSLYLNSVTLEKCTKSAHRFTNNILVAKDGERIIGFIGYGSYRDQTLPEHGEIFALYVLQEYHGQKVGYALMNAAMNQLANYDRIALWVLKGNDRAIEFYQKYGFRFDGTQAEILLGTPNTVLRMIYKRN